MNRTTRVAVAFVTVAALSSCAVSPTEREMNHLASALTKVSAAVDATVRFRRPAESLSEAELLRDGTAADPALLKPFEGYTVRVMREGRNSAVLVCDRLGQRALLEDAGCTARMDVHRWMAHGEQSCGFAIDLKSICTR